MEHKTTIFVTGLGGQLASELQEISRNFSEYAFLFSGIEDFDITDERAVELYFQNNTIQYCINTAAYTAVDEAETHEEDAWKVNVNGAGNLARACKKYGALFMHISTDFIFDGARSVPYTEEDIPHPLSAYGKTKLEGERRACEECERTIIVRTAWLYSRFGKNFVKTIVEKGKERGKLSVVCDQIGTPTYAADLASALMRIIQVYDTALPAEKETLHGIYHYTNEGVASWYDFAQAIVEYSGITCALTPVSTGEYPLPARRPSFSVLDKKKIRDRFGLIISHWRESLRRSIIQEK